MDTLSYLLQSVQLRTAVYTTIWLRPPWGIRIPAGPSAAFHAIVHGHCLLHLDGGASGGTALGAGDVVVLAHGHGHTFVDAPGSPVRLVDPVSAQGPPPGLPRPPPDPAATDPGGTAVICGHLWFDDPAAGPLVDLLPPLVHFRSAAGGRPAGWLAPVLQAMALEGDGQAPGGQALLTRLSDVIVIQAIRDHVSRLPADEHGPLRALGDTALGEALGLIHQHPEQPWTVARLATRVGLSRSTFAARFTEVVGEAPMRYLAGWRIRHAQRLLRDTGYSVANIGARVGYQTEPAFSRAFKQRVGMAPGTYRRAVAPDA
jgi:AraC-like DNA-binding protein